MAEGVSAAAQAASVVKRGAVYWVNLNPRKGSEQGNIRPCLVVSPDSVNSIAEWNMVTVIPLTTKGRANAFRVATEVGGQPGFALIQQTRAIDKSRLGNLVGELDMATQEEILKRLRQFFT